MKNHTRPHPGSLPQGENSSNFLRTVRPRTHPQPLPGGEPLSVLRSPPGRGQGWVHSGQVHGQGKAVGIPYSKQDYLPAHLLTRSPAHLLLLLCLAISLTVVSTTAAEHPSAVSGITEPFLDVTLSTSVAGIISAQKFKEGEMAKEGEVILELDKRLEELEALRRQLVVDRSKTDLDGTQLLFKTTKSVSKEELDKKEVEYKVAVVEHGMAAEQLRKRQLTAPFTGVITEFFLDVGEACQPYQPLLRLVDTRRCYFVSNIEAKAAGKLKVDQQAKLEIETGTATLPIQGKIIFLSPVVDPASGLLKVKVLFDNSDGKIRPGLAGKMFLD